MASIKHSEINAHFEHILKHIEVSINEINKLIKHMF
jgi:hypothetical protein